MSLTKEKRESLADSDFAVPEKRALPIHDAVHLKMAHNMIDKTAVLTEEDKALAQERILAKAQDLDVDISKWKLEISNVASFSAMAIDLPHVEDHPNKTPFKGVLTKLNQPSDFPPGGSGRKRVVLSSDIAEKGLSSLLGMGIGFCNDFDGHDAQKKIGIITSADVVSNEIVIEGFFYSADFPNQVKRIQAEKDDMGFSFEAQVRTKPMNDDLLEIIECIFTGAAVLYKNKAAYTTTSIAANAEDQSMSTEILDAIKALGERVDSFSQQIEEIKAAGVESNPAYKAVKPHADAMHKVADEMQKAGIGMQDRTGHVALLRSMANSMSAEAMMGKMPHVYRESGMYASNEKEVVEVKASAELIALQDSIAALTTKVTDAEKARIAASSEPTRKTITPEISAIIQRTGIEASGDRQFSVSEIDNALAEKNISIENRFKTKLLMAENEMIKGAK